MDMKIIGVVFCSLIALNAGAQKPNCQNLNLKNDSVFGVSTERAYAEILSHKKKYKTVIVGVSSGFIFGALFLSERRNLDI
jgi:hypothetical protein